MILQPVSDLQWLDVKILFLPIKTNKKGLSIDNGSQTETTYLCKLYD